MTTSLTAPHPAASTDQIDRQYVVAVRALCEFTAKRGDLDVRFTPSPTAQEGIAGHTLVTSRRAEGYEREISLSGRWQHLLVRGRADGYDPVRNQLEEIKTFRGDLGRMPDNHRHLHWAQLRIYGWLMCQQRGLTSLTLALVYFDIGSQQEIILTETQDAPALRAFFEAQCARFLAWSEQELAHRNRRNLACRALMFPHAAFRTGQRELSQAVWQAAASARCLLAQAPTGIGKTIGTLFPLVKALPTQRLDKIFFLAAKTSGRTLALDAARLLQRRTPALPLRVLELVARDQACEYPDKACHGESCPLAKGFYDRLPAARAEATAVAVLDQRALRAVALAHQICPYYLSQDLVRWSDLIIGDYNYYFDANGLLHSLLIAHQWRAAILVDEAHNLIDRARGMYSATLDQASVKAVRATAPIELQSCLNRLVRQWQSLCKLQSAPYQVLPALPASFINGLQQAITAIGDYFAEAPTVVHAGLQQFYFSLLQFSRLLETFGDHSFIDLTLADAGRASLSLRNVVPAPFLQPRFAASHSTTLFSATLSPWHFYSDMLGLPDSTAWVDVPSPFSAAQLQVKIIRSISTRFSDRDASLMPIVDLIARQFAQRAGNYLTFVSSFDYLEKLSGLLRRCHPHIPAWEQARRMDQSGRDAFLAQFIVGGNGIGFAVLGGAFAEGIDLPGDRLIGAFIATLGMPQMNPINAQIQQRMEQQFGAGYDYTYLFPGLQKVVQAAGRVIRSESDQGVVILIDDRFQRREVQALLPRWWRPEVA